MAVATALVDVIVFQEHRCGQHDVGVAGGFEELLVHHREQVFAREALLHPRLVRRQLETGLVFWMKIAFTGGPPCRSCGLPHSISPTRH